MMYVLCVSFSLANRSKGVPPAAWQGPDLKNIQNRIQKNFVKSSASVISEITERMLHYLIRADSSSVVK